MLVNVLECRLQVVGGKQRYGGISNAFKAIVSEEGLASLYKGAAPRMLICGPMFGFTLLSFDFMKKYLEYQ